MKILLFGILLCMTGCCKSTTKREGESEQEGPGDASTAGNRSDDVTEDRQPFLRITSDMKDQNLVSGERVQFKCKVESWPNDSMEYTWYKDNEIFTDDEDPSKITIRSRATGSRLTIKDLLTTDSGIYRCEVSNGYMRDHTTANLKVSFSLPPEDDSPLEVGKIPQAKCEIYSGQACTSQLAGKTVYVDPFLTQTQMEVDIRRALKRIASSVVSQKCKHYAYPAFCNFVFPPCEYRIDPKTSRRKAARIKLCREDCELMKYDVCANAYLHSVNDKFLQEIFAAANCSSLPPTTVRGSKCTKVGLPSVVDKTHQCYNDSGSSYRGLVSVTRSRKSCVSWPKNMLFAGNVELAGGHNFCRNPGNEMNAPWCYVDIARTVKETCLLKKCVQPTTKGTDMIVILIPSVTIPFVIGCVVIALCYCRKKNSGNGKMKAENKKAAPGKMIDMSTFPTHNLKVPELNASHVHLLVEIGECQYGKVYKATVSSNPQFSTNFPVAVKTVCERALSMQYEEFQREVDVFSQLQHENVACLKAIVTQPTMRCMVFEYTNNIDLHEYLVSHSPQADFAKPVSSASSHASSVIEHTDFLRMAVQIVSGMEYLASNNYVHRDLAARNVLICGNMDLKISNLGVVRDSYLSSYYRSPQGGQMLPIRWMAPESLHTWQFSDKTTVWSFGVLLWEMFSYGLQPYCGYSNHEVLDMISRRQLLTCPDQCPAKMYSLMLECWTAQPLQRPDFKDIRAKLQGWECSNTGSVTSQLAQGIHRQLTNVMRDGTGRYNDYYQASSIGGSSGITYNSGVGATPTPPPQYAECLQMKGSSPSVLTNQGGTQFPNSSGPYQNFQPNPPQPHPMAYGSSLPQQQQFFPGGQAMQHPRRGHMYRKGPASHSSRSSSSCASSSHEQYPPVHPTRQMNGDKHYENYNHPPFSGPGNRPLSGVAEDEDSYGEEDRLYQQPRPVAARAPLVVRTNPSSQENRQAPSDPIPQKAEQKIPDIDSSDASGNSFRATSCDSGLPIDDVDGTDPRAPLMGRPQIPAKSSQVRGPTPRMFV